MHDLAFVRTRIRPRWTLSRSLMPTTASLKCRIPSRFLPSPSRSLSWWLCWGSVQSRAFQRSLHLWALCDSRLGLWTVEASYVDDFTTKTKTDFQVKEYGKTKPVVSMTLSDFEVHDQHHYEFHFFSSSQFFHSCGATKKLHQLWTIQSLSLQSVSQVSRYAQIVVCHS